MRNLRNLFFLALVALAVSLSPAQAQSQDLAPNTIHVTQPALGSEAYNVADLDTICYYGVTLIVREKIAKRYLKLGATEGSCATALVLQAADESQLAAAGDLVTVCYYGVTLQVRPKIAGRLIRIGATEGACGSALPATLVAVAIN